MLKVLVIMTDDRAVGYDLESSASEQSELDSLLVKLTTSALGFSVALGVLDNGSPWLVASWCFLLLSIATVLASKFMAIEALRADYQARTHKDAAIKKMQKTKGAKIDTVVQFTNYAAGALFLIGAALVVAHMFDTI